MSEWKTIEDDGLPPAGVPLIVTVASEDNTYQRLCYPVIYRKSFVRDEWRFYEDGSEEKLIGPFLHVTAWQLFPKPFTGVKEKEKEEKNRAGNTTCWVSVEEDLPHKGQETWVYAIPPEGINADPEVEKDYYEGNRGEIIEFPEEDGGTERQTNGWHYYCWWNVTHWRPIVKPEPPEGAQA